MPIRIVAILLDGPGRLTDPTEQRRHTEKAKGGLLGERRVDTAARVTWDRVACDSGGAGWSWSGGEAAPGGVTCASHPRRTAFGGTSSVSVAHIIRRYSEVGKAW